MTVNYQYQPPVKFAYPTEIPHLLADATSVDKSESKMADMAKALRVRVNFERTKTKNPKDGETREYLDGTRRWKVYPRSGMIKFVDQTLYNRLPVGLASRRALSEDEATSAAKRLIRRLASAGVIDEAQVLWDAPHVYYSRMQGSTGRAKKWKGQAKNYAHTGRRYESFSVSNRKWHPRFGRQCPNSLYATRGSFFFEPNVARRSDWSEELSPNTRHGSS